ncbi:MAG: 30S ribosomal protein S20 [Lentisphaeria bacterium]
MPNSLSAAKRDRQNLKRYNRNKTRKNAIKRARKEFEKALEQNDLETARNTLQDCYKALDKAAQKNTIAENKAARLKSRLSRRLNIVEQ